MPISGDFSHHTNPNEPFLPNPRSGGIVLKGGPATDIGKPVPQPEDPLLLEEKAEQQAAYQRTIEQYLLAVGAEKPRTKGDSIFKQDGSTTQYSYKGVRFNKAGDWSGLLDLKTIDTKNPEPSHIEFKVENGSVMQVRVFFRENPGSPANSKYTLPQTLWKRTEGSDDPVHFKDSNRSFPVLFKTIASSIPDNLNTMFRFNKCIVFNLENPVTDPKN